MARLAYSKASLSNISAKLKRFKQFLPSLDLKRQQLAAERKKAQLRFAQTELEIQQCYQNTAKMLPMLADKSINVQNLVKLTQVEMGEENVVGVHLPVLNKLSIEVSSYSLFTEPHWVDQLVVQLKTMLQLKIQRQVEQQRVETLSEALKKVTQRVNLFDKVLIPQAQQDIRKIRIYLSDLDRAGVVRAKSTKQKRLRLKEVS
ncbi:MAG: V-type ATP synthase subunit D [Gammaproteobacteria bacterium]|nr:V-type ATP synthase subunit D [Gammaproteobacteria bacterium]MBT5223435.1 V-type ATP synthase subunit D [Gammaproteobacteria bacterium]MBT5825069.1 V-type ATP synthase subunit D [Gammaproteobacteria bacterium]MBT5966999.1 V-type ATP synthase subunit D [Gammaproteobacteria bacterium]MBT6420488.1 V-type ATP synthase subunit D [Gammaproteobacteria bacterium]